MFILLPQVVGDRFEAFGIVNGSAIEEVEVTHHPLENMVEGREAEGFEWFSRRKTGDGSQYVGKDIPVAQHHALWYAGGAGGIDDGSQVFVPDPVGDGPDPFGAVPACFASAVPSSEVRLHVQMYRFSFRLGTRLRMLDFQEEVFVMHKTIFTWASLRMISSSFTLIVG